MAKKIGIVTEYYRNYNYGGVLQAYALQKALSDMGYSVEQISYDYESEFAEVKSAVVKNTLKKYLKYILIEYNRRHHKYEKNMEPFIKSIPHTKRVNSKNINSVEKFFDVFICGSDQIWNPMGWQDAFFLRFTEKYRISYAASIARDTLNDEELNYIEECTKDFLALSVREKNSSDFLTKELGREYKLVPDPTLLLTREEWNNRFPTKSKKHPYIFAYFLGFNEQQRNECISFADKIGLDIYFVPFMKKDCWEWDKHHIDKCMDKCSVDDFVEMIRNARLVLTDSYHGTVFSCLFETPFYVLNRQLVATEKSMNSRINTLFLELGIPSSRFIESLDEKGLYEFTEDEKETMKRKINMWRTIGLSFLKKGLDMVE